MPHIPATRVRLPRVLRYMLAAVTRAHHQYDNIINITSSIPLLNFLCPHHRLEDVTVVAKTLCILAAGFQSSATLIWFTH